MPEGPEIRRAADSLEAAIKGKPLTDVWFAFPQLPFSRRCWGECGDPYRNARQSVADALFHNLTLYSHNQLYGVWRVVEAGETETNRVLRVRLAAKDKAILLYSASDIEMLTPEQLAVHPFCSASGRMCWICADRDRSKRGCYRPNSATGSFPVCCSIRRFWPGWGTTCAWKSCGRWGWRRSIKHRAE
jgi:hypothetical protein